MLLTRNNVNVSGQGSRAMVFRMVLVATRACGRRSRANSKASFRVILFDHVGAGRPTSPPTTRRNIPASTATPTTSSRSGGDRLEEAVFVGHSVSAMIGALASIKAPGMFTRPRDGRAFAPLHRRRRLCRRILARPGDGAARISRRQSSRLVGRDGAGDHGQSRPSGTRRGLDNSFCATDPGDSAGVREGDFPVRQPRGPAIVEARTLILQCREDIIAPTRWANLFTRKSPDSRYRLLNATGHCPNLSAPEEVTTAIREFV